LISKIGINALQRAGWFSALIQEQIDDRGPLLLYFIAIGSFIVEVRS
jgi:hypothetical protein